MPVSRCVATIGGRARAVRCRLWVTLRTRPCSARTWIATHAFMHPTIVPGGTRWRRRGGTAGRNGRCRTPRPPPVNPQHANRLRFHRLRRLRSLPHLQRQRAWRSPCPVCRHRLLRPQRRCRATRWMCGWINGHSLRPPLLSPVTSACRQQYKAAPSKVGSRSLIHCTSGASLLSPSCIGRGQSAV